MTRIEFTVLGTPQPQGSKTVAQAKRGRPFVREASRELQPWRQAVAAAAVAAMDGREELLMGPARITATFVLRRPKGHFGTGRNAGRLKPSAPLYVKTRPDADKLVRAVADAISGVVYADDSQLVVVHAEKHYGEPACAHVVVEELDLENDRAVSEALGL